MVVVGVIIVIITYYSLFIAVQLTSSSRRRPGWYLDFTAKLAKYDVSYVEYLKARGQLSAMVISHHNVICMQAVRV